MATTAVFNDAPGRGLQLNGVIDCASGGDCGGNRAIETTSDSETMPPAKKMNPEPGRRASDSAKTPNGMSETPVDSYGNVEIAVCPPSPQEAKLLAKMEALNRMIEQETTKSTSGGSRKSNDGSSSSVSDSQSHISLQDQDSVAQLSTFDYDGQLEDDVWAVWGSLLRNWETESKKRVPYVRDLVRKGIPCHFRTIAWQLLSGANVESAHEVYADYMRAQSPYEKVIIRDISRTYPEHEFFREENGPGQMSLLNVMKAYSLYDREVGYCQGSAFIAGLLLLQMPEEEAFAVLIRLMEHYGLRGLYKPAMTDLGLCMFQLESLVQEQMPDLYMHFQNMGFDTSMYASSWFLTLFTTALPIELSYRVMDLFVSEGMEMIFRLGMAILQLSRFELLQLDMEGMLRHFQREVAAKYENDPDLLVTSATLVKYDKKRMKKLEKDYMTKRTKEAEEAVELRRLRTENRLLRQRIDYLEKESEALADRLIQGQVNWAEEAEACISVKQQMYSLRELNQMAHRQLEEAYDTIRELSRPRDNVVDRQIQVDDQEMITIIHNLQKELMGTKTREADNENIIRDLKLRIQELENSNKRLRETPPDHSVATLQEELISVKMREAEASLSIKEMRQHIAELEVQWEKYTNHRSLDPSETPKNDGAGDSSGQKGLSARELEDMLMGLRLREADTIAELKEMRQKVMELETQNHVCTNQLKRQDEEYRRLQSHVEDVKESEKGAIGLCKEGDRKLGVMEAELHEQRITSRLRETELMTTISELKGKVCEAETRHAEALTQRQLDSSANAAFQLACTPTTPNSLSNSLDSVSSEFDLCDMRMKAPSLTSLDQLSPNPLLLRTLVANAAAHDGASDSDTTIVNGGILNAAVVSAAE